ncbi:MAG: GAF domain-containing sensor histidine kinase [Acidimicrobiales bacterium]
MSAAGELAPGRPAALWPRRLGVVVGAGVAMGGALVAAGWVSHELVLVAPAGTAALPVIGAFAAVLVGLGLVAAAEQRPAFTTVSGVLVLATGAFGVAQLVAGRALGTDQLRFGEFLHRDPRAVRLAPELAVGLILLGLALVVRARLDAAGWVVGLSAGVALVALVSVVEVAGLDTSLFGSVDGTQVGGTGVALLILGALGLFLAVGERAGPVHALWVDDSLRAPLLRRSTLPTVAVMGPAVALASQLVQRGAGGPGAARLVTGVGAGALAVAVAVLCALVDRLAPSLGRSVADAVDAVGLRSMLAEREAEATRLDALEQDVGRATDPSAALGVFASVAEQALDVEEASLWSVEEHQARLVAAVGPGQPPRGTTLPWDEAGGLELPRDRERSTLAVPIVAGGKVLAVLSVGSANPDAYDEGARATLETLVSRATGGLAALLLADRERHATERQRDVAALQDTVLGMVARELRSPMTVIGGMAETLQAQRSELSEEQQDQLLAAIARDLAGLNRLLEDVVAMARIESGELTYLNLPFDLGDLVRRVVDELGGAERCVVRLAPDLPEALGDEERQGQILSHLVANALATPAPAFAPPEVSVTPTTDRLTVSVRDHGPGMAPDALGRVFDRFSRPARSDGSGSATSLGLWICKALVEAQGGEMGVESSPGQGTSFIYTVPISGRPPGEE